MTQNMAADAVHHYLFIKDWETAAEMIEDVGLRELAETGEDCACCTGCNNCRRRSSRAT